MGLGGSGTSSNNFSPAQIVAGGVTAIAAECDGQHAVFCRSGGSFWSVGNNRYGQLGNGTVITTNQPQEILAPYNRISGQRSADGQMHLVFAGTAGASYALDRSRSMVPPIWIPQMTNSANSFGALVFTNPPAPQGNNFWRVRSVP